MCSIVSQGGYIANAYTYGSRMLISTDVFQLLGDTNYDFLYHSLLLYAQQTAGELHNESPNSEIYHFHITCESCLRPIEEPILDSETGYQFLDKSQNLKNWKPENVQWMKTVELISIQEGQWGLLSLGQQSREVGVMHGVVYGELHKSYSDVVKLYNLFPITLRSKVLVGQYLEGLMKTNKLLVRCSRLQFLTFQLTLLPLIKIH